jgi:iron-sulfur cluster assembly protein
MIKVTKAAAEQILASAKEGGMENMALRLAAKKLPDGSFDYGMGFDEAKDDDLSYNCEGLEVIFQPEYGPMLSGAVLDYVEMEPGEYRFIFMNPNDPNYKPPEGGPAPEPQSN